MIPLAEPQVRAAFVNCSKGEAKRLNVPRDLADQPWGDLDYLGWRDPQSPGRGYLVTVREGEPWGIVLRVPESKVGQGRRNMCSLCVSVHSGGVSLMVAPRAGKAGQVGHSAGTYICSDLRCSLYVRRKLATNTTGMNETLTIEQRVERLVANLESFAAKVDR